MFTVNIRKIMAGKGGIKWNTPGTTTEIPKEVSLVEKLSKVSNPATRDALIDSAIKSDPKAVNSELNNLSVTLFSTEGKEYSKYKELIIAIEAGETRVLEASKVTEESLKKVASPEIAKSAKEAGTNLAVGTTAVIKEARKNEAILQVNIAAGGDFQSSLDK